MNLTFVYRTLPRENQYVALDGFLEGSRLLYNAALEQRIAAYRLHGKVVSYFDQTAELTQWREEDPDAAAVPMQIQRWTLKRNYVAVRTYAKRLKEWKKNQKKARKNKGQSEKIKGKPGHPRFRGKGWHKTFGFNEFSGIRLIGDRLYWKGMPGGLRIHFHRPLPEGAKILSCWFSRDDKGWRVGFQVVVPAAPKREVKKATGLDYGLNHYATLSNGERIANRREARRSQRQVKRAHQAIQRTQKGSKGREKAKRNLRKIYRKQTDRRLTFAHQETARLVREYDLIGDDGLDIEQMKQTGKCTRGIHDASWGRFSRLLTYKAERAGCWLVSVPAYFTSQKCWSCGRLIPKDLSVRRHVCPCGVDIDRDQNAALNHLCEAVVQSGFGHLLDQLVEQNVGSGPRVGTKSGLDPGSDQEDQFELPISN